MTNGSVCCNPIIITTIAIIVTSIIKSIMCCIFIFINFLFSFSATTVMNDANTLNIHNNIHNKIVFPDDNRFIYTFVYITANIPVIIVHSNVFILNSLLFNNIRYIKNTIDKNINIILEYDNIIPVSIKNIATPYMYLFIVFFLYIYFFLYY